MGWEGNDGGTGFVYDACKGKEEKDCRMKTRKKLYIAL